MILTYMYKIAASKPIRFWFWFSARCCIFGIFRNTSTDDETQQNRPPPNQSDFDSGSQQDLPSDSNSESSSGLKRRLRSQGGSGSSKSSWLEISKKVEVGTGLQIAYPDIHSLFIKNNRLSIFLSNSISDLYRYNPVLKIYLVINRIYRLIP